MMICLRVSLSSRNIFQILLLERDDGIFSDRDNRISLKYEDKALGGGHQGG